MNLLQSLAAIVNADSRVRVTMETIDNIVLLLPNDYTVSIGYGSGHYGSNRYGSPDILCSSVELLVANHFGDIVAADSVNDVHGWFPCEDIPAFVAELSKR